MRIKSSVMPVIMLFVAIILSGCGGRNAITTPGTSEIKVPAGMIVEALYVDGEGAVSDDTYVSYKYQTASSGEAKTVGVFVSGKAYLGGYSGCGLSGVPVRFKAYIDGTTQIGPTKIVYSNSWGGATTTIDTTNIVASPDSVKRITVRTEVADPNVLIPGEDMVIDIVGSGLSPRYSAQTEQNSSFNLVSGQDPTYPDGLHSIRVKNTGNIGWSGFENRLNRVYMIPMQGAEVFYNDRSWYSTSVVSDLAMWNQDLVLPGESAYMYFYLSAHNVTPGEYNPCFKLYTKPEYITSAYNDYSIINPLYIEGSDFCIHVSVVSPASIARVALKVPIPRDKLFGKMYWESKSN